MQQFEGAAPANGVGGLRRDSQTIPCAQADLVPLQAQRHITLQHIIDRVAEVALLTDALSVPKSQQRHLAVLAAGKGHAHHAPRLDGDEFPQSRRLLNRQIAERIGDGMLLSKTVRTDWTADACVLYCRIEGVFNIGQTCGFELLP